MMLTQLNQVRSRFRRAGVAALGGVALALAIGVAAPVEARSYKGPDSVADLVVDLQDAVVNISTSQTIAAEKSVPMPQIPQGSPFQEFFEEFFKNRQNPNQGPRKAQSLGSGFVIDAAGIIITNNHVIDGADEITANFADGTKLKAKLLGTDKKTDIAVLQVTPTKPLKAVPFGDSDKARVGDWVMAIGNPFGLGGSVTVGIVSARNRDISAGPYDNFIQTDAAINKGNSGGPLFNMQGEVVGINTAIYSPSGGSVGIGFSVPSNTAVSVISQIREFGQTRRGWLGVRIQNVTDDIAEGLGLKEPKGALVAGITEGGPAEKAGVQAGDVILKFDGKDVPSSRELPRMVADAIVGKDVPVTVLRKGKEQDIRIVLGRLEEGEKAAAAESGRGSAPEAKPVATKALGLTLSDITGELRSKFKIKDNVKGVIVAEVEAGSAAAEKRVVAGDVIVEIAQEPVKTPQEAVDRLALLKKEGRKSALMLIANGEGELRFVAVRIE